ncbi:MAG TPA: VWA domain-containing protein [Thermoanaerobaculia bacterium]
MRAALTLLLALATLPAIADVDFDLAVNASRVQRQRVVIPVELSIAVNQLRFVEDGKELAARYSVASIIDGETRVVVKTRRLTAPLGKMPIGVVTSAFDVAVDAGVTRVEIAVIDENAQTRGTRAIVIDGTKARVDGVAEDSDAKWREALERGGRERKPIVVFFRARPCGLCRRFERVTLPHPTTQRRLPDVVFATLPADQGEAAKQWASRESGVGLFDRTGVLRVRWNFVPETANFNTLLESAIAVAPDLERIATLKEGGEADLILANVYARLRFLTDARAALTRARERGDATTQQKAIVAAAMLDANDGLRAQALQALSEVAANAQTPEIAADAWMAIGAIHRASRATDDAIRAFTAAAKLDSPVRVEAEKALAGLRAVESESGVVRILPIGRQVVSGRHVVRTHVSSADVARVAFSLDGRAVTRIERPPFSATLDFGNVPERRTIRVVALDRRGRELGRDERVVNEAGETFWLRLMSPREGFASGRVRVSMSLRTPATSRVRRVVVSWNDAERATLTTAPWDATIAIPDGVVGVLRAVAELDDGRTSEDAVLLNAGGMMGLANVQLIELPVTAISRDGSAVALTPDRIIVREGSKTRRVESIATAAETPVTIGLLIDSSESMHSTLPDVQEAAIRFLETILGERDRAFLITFDSRARLVQTATSDVARLRTHIMNIHADGLTALHDAMVLGLLQFEGIKGRRALIVFSDGSDRASEYSAADVRELAQRVNVPIHLIASIENTPAQLDENAPQAPRGLAIAEWESSTKELRRASQSTGGSTHTLDNLAELPSVYARIEAALRAQILAFVRTDPAVSENEWRAIRVEISGRDIDVFAPEGYSPVW